PETIRIFIELMSVDKLSYRITPSMGKVKSLKKRGVTPLKRNTICPTITSIPDDFVHYSEPRIMTVREHARIQSFPDNFHFKGSYTTGGSRRKKEVPRYTQVANAVPPLFAEQVGLTIFHVGIYNLETEEQ
ncbi:DNA cytosine methyltransferase, partial [Listeria monocytogenes]|nr:DNA cytosine methyltransferase [Listeria monocytogenes]